MLSYNVLNSWVEKMMKKSLPVKIKTSDITNLSTKDINKLKAGDIVLKKTRNQKHAYIVSYKEDNQGICFTYTDATVIETVSYDYVDGEWVYNSTDIGRVGGVEYTAGDGISLVNNVISNTKPNKQLYQHNVKLALADNNGLIDIEFVSATETYTKSEFMQYVNNNFNAQEKLITASGIYKGTYENNKYTVISGAYSTNVSDLILTGESITFDFTNGTLSVGTTYTSYSSSDITFYIKSLPL